MKYSAIGAHIYAGGFTVGVSRHFDVLAHLEHNGYGAEVVKMNFPGLPIYPGGPSTWPSSWPRGQGRPRFLYANPPCAIWSSAGKGVHGKWVNDPRLQVHHDIMNYAMDVVTPDVVAIESVPPSFTEGRRHVDNLIAKAADNGYSSTIVMHDAKYLGVAQRRSRIFYIFHKVSMEWELPSFDDAPTVRDVFRKLSKKKTRGFDPTLNIAPSDRILLERAAPGEKFRQVYDRMHPDPQRGARGQKLGSPSFLDQRIPWDKPSPVIIANKLYHPEEDRYLTQEELAALSSFPPNYLWPIGKSADISGFMSRGVMPNVGDWLARCVATALDRGKRPNKITSELLDFTKPPGSIRDLVTAEPTFHREDNDMPKKTVVASTQATQPPDREPSEGSGAYMRRLLINGWTDDPILAAVHRQFPGSKATKSDVSYNKNKLKKEGMPSGGMPVAVAQPKAPPKTVKGQIDLPWEQGAKPAKAAAPSRTEAEALHPFAAVRGRISALRRVPPTRATVEALVALATAVMDHIEKLAGD